MSEEARLGADGDDATTGCDDGTESEEEGTEREPPEATAPPRDRSPSKLTWIRMSNVELRCSTAALDSAATSRNESTDSTTSAYRTTDFALLRCNWPTKCQRSPAGTAAALAAASWSLFSPTSVTPSAASSSTSLAG